MLINNILIISRREDWREHTYPYVQNFIPDTIAPFRLLLDKEPVRAAAGGIFDNVSHLKQVRQKKIKAHTFTFNDKIHFSGNEIHTISSKMLLVPVLLRLDLLEERGVRAAGGEAMGGAAVGVCLFIVLVETLAVDATVWPGEGAASGAEADVLVVQDEENKGVCVEAVVVQGLEAEREGWGGGKHVGTGFVVADGRSEAKEAGRVSDRQVVLGVRGTGRGGGEGAGGRDEYNDVGGKKEKGRQDDGDKHPASSLSISLSNFTSPGGSTPYLKERFYKNTSAIVRINQQ